MGRRFIEIRLARGWTQETCAEKLWLDVRLLRRIEGGRHNLTVSTLVRLAQRLEVPTSALFEPSGLQAARRPGRRRATDGALASTQPASRSSGPSYSPPSATAAQAVGEKARRASRARAPRRTALKK